jgi:hypothetical protein
MTKATLSSFIDMLLNDTICSLICAKQNQNMECYEYCPDSELLKKAKTACIDYNNEGYLGCFENNSFISHISPQKVPTSEKLTEHNVQNEDSLPSELGRKN